MLRHLPNLLSFLRLLAAPVTAFLIYQGIDKAALGIFAFAGLSDAVDGYLAKRLAPGSRFGVYLDPAADKLLMLACFIMLTYIHMTPLWLTAVVIGRDIAIILGLTLARVMALPVQVAPLMIGKACTGVQVGYVALALVVRAFSLNLPMLMSAAAIAVAIFTIASWLAYGQVLIKAIALRRKTA